jgi:hypothetical protein
LVKQLLEVFELGDLLFIGHKLFAER